MSFDPHTKITTDDAHKIICDIVESNLEIAIPGHAQKRMSERGFSTQDVLHVLLNGKITKQKFHDESHSWRYTVSGVDLDGDDGKVITVIVNKGQLVVITVM